MPPIASSDHTSARDEAAAATRSAAVHDVVIAAGKAMYGRELDDRDRAALRNAEQLLDRLISKEVVTSLPTTLQLADDGQAVRTLRLAAGMLDDDTREKIASLRAAARSVTRGKAAPTEDAAARMAEVRQLFLMVEQMTLRDRVREERETEPGALWQLTTSSD